MIRAVLIRRGGRLDDEQREHALALLPQREQKRIRGFSHWQSAQSSLLGHLLLRRLAVGALGEGQPILFDRDHRGRPLLVAPAHSTIDLNMSHSGDYVAAAISRGPRVGIDVQVQREVRADVAGRCFAASERAWIDAGDADGDRESRFFQLWTLKEAYLKATGQGIATDLKAIVFTIADGIRVRVENRAAPAWRFRSWRLGTDAWMSLCVDGAEPPGDYEDEPVSIE